VNVFQSLCQIHFVVAYIVCNSDFLTLRPCRKKYSAYLVLRPGDKHYLRFHFCWLLYIMPTINILPSLTITSNFYLVVCCNPQTSMDYICVDNSLYQYILRTKKNRCLDTEQCGRILSTSKSKSHYDRRSVLVSDAHLGPSTNFTFS
jgi:hypothetical protein